jgi:hypothetical protein
LGSNPPYRPGDLPAAREFRRKIPLRVKTNLSNRINVICPVQTSLKKYFA